MNSTQIQLERATRLAEQHARTINNLDLQIREMQNRIDDYNANADLQREALAKKCFIAGTKLPRVIDGVPVSAEHLWLNYKAQEL